jgi:HD-GYP domain-containing protein (c-di-GMP phosphodiesterase class II)
LLCENQTVTAELIARLKKTIFPETMVYIPIQYLINSLFANGHFLGFTKSEVHSIRNGEKFWERDKIADLPKKKTAPPNLNRLQHKTDIEEYKKVVKKYEEEKAASKNMMAVVAETGKVDNNQKEEITKNVQTQINKTDVSMIIQTINRIRTADEYLHTHCLNVAFLNGLMGKWLKYDAVKQNEVVECGLLHDIGKLGIAPEILNKPARLTKEEFEEIKRHPFLSFEMLLKSGVRNKGVLDGIVQHHEKVNGTGYPVGLEAKEICEYARITAISDIYDAMVAKRVYKEPRSPFEILHEFGQGAYSELDIKLVTVFIECMIEELKGKEVVMSDGREAIVLLVNPRRLLYPIVEVDGETVMTNEELKVAKMKDVSDVDVSV